MENQFSNVKKMFITMESFLSLIGIFAGLQTVPTSATLTSNMNAFTSSPRTHRSFDSSFIQPQGVPPMYLKHGQISNRPRSSAVIVTASGSRMNALQSDDKNDNNRNRIRDLAKIDDARANDTDALIVGETRTKIWEIQNGALKQVDLNNFFAFQFDKCYVLLQNSFDESDGNMVADVFYWIGKDSSNVDAADAASLAVVMDAKMHEVMQVRREVEGQESEDFQVLFKLPENEVADSGSLTRTSTKLDENRKRMFVIEGEDAPNAREVELSTVPLLGNDNKCVVFVSNKVYIGCRKGASVRHKKSARQLAAIMMKRRKLKKEEPKIHRIDNMFSEVSKEEQEDLLEFFAEFGKIPAEVARQQIAENPEIFNAAEIRRITDQTVNEDGKTEFFRLKVTRIYEEQYEHIVEEQDDSYPRLPLVLIDTKACYILDTQSNLGIVVLIGKDSEIQVRRECARRAEIYAYENGYGYASPIVFVDQRGIRNGAIGDLQELICLVHSIGDGGEDEEIESNKIDDSSTMPLDKPMMIMWRVNKGGALERITNGIALESDKSYVLFQYLGEATPETEEPTSRVFYWVGEDSSDDDAAEAASHAVVLDVRVHKTAKIFREAEGHETPAFKAFFKQLFLRDFSVKKKDKVEITKTIEESTRRLDTNRKKMFVIEVDEREKLHFKEVPLSFMNMLGSDRNCLVLVSEKVYVASGSWITNSQKKGAIELAKIMMERRNMKVEEIKKVHQIDQLFSPELLDAEERDDLRQFFEEFDRIPVEEAEQLINDNPEKFEPQEVRKILDQTILQFDGREWFDVKVFRLFENFVDKTAQLEYKRTFRLLPMNELDSKYCYLVDSQSTVGLFVWMGKESGLALRRGSARRAEFYLKSQKYHNSTFITYVSQEDVSPDTKSVQAMVYDKNPEKQVNLPVIDASPPVPINDGMGCSDCKASGMCVNCPKRQARIAARGFPEDEVSELVPPDEDSAVIDVKSISSTSTSRVEPTGHDSVDEDSNDEEAESPTAITDDPEMEKSSPPKNLVPEGKSTTRRRAKKAMKSDMVGVDLASLKGTVEKQSEKLQDALSFSQITQLLENSKATSTSAKEALEPLKLSTINPDTITAQLDLIYSKIKDRSTKIRITKLKGKISQEF